jgi:Dolichyl-phosphate-mannose-protein mannosyltransferase
LAILNARAAVAFWASLGLFALVAACDLAAPRLDSDQAVTGLMGFYILRGDFPLVFWGQHHAGVPESYGAAVSFFLLGVSRASLSLVPTLAALGLMLLVYRTGRTLFGPRTGALGVVFTAVASPYVFAHYVRARSYYVEHLVLGQVLLLGAALWLVHGPTLRETGRSRVLIAMGLAGGLGLYCGFQIVDALLPALTTLLLVDLRLPLRRRAWLGVGAFGLASLPFWVYNLSHDWATFGVGLQFQGREPAAEAGRTIFTELLPVVLGMREWVNTPSFLPWPASLVIPIAVVTTIAWSAVRVVGGARRLRQDPALAGEALLLLTLAVTIGVVWYGRFVRVPRYLVPVAPVLALLLARACQLAWRRAPVVAAVGAGVYLLAVGIPLVSEVTVLRPARLAAYRAERAADEALFEFLRVRDLTRVYSFEHWLAPRLTFDARAEVIVAEAWNERYTPHVDAVDRSPHPAYVVRSEHEAMRAWLRSLGVRARETQVGGYTVFHDFTPPPEAAPLARSTWTVRTSVGRGASASIVDAQLDTGWAAAKGPPRSAWVEVDLGAEHPVSGVVLMTDRSDRIPGRLAILAEGDGGARREVTTVVTNGVTVTWLNGAPRIRPGRTLTARFPPIPVRRLRLVEAGPAERWSVAELFVLGPLGAGPVPREPAAVVHEAQELEATGQMETALLRYHEAMQRAPDVPDGYEGFARLATEVRLGGDSPIAQAAQFSRLGLLDEARTMYEEIARTRGPEQTHAELTRVIARLAEAAGDRPTATRLETQAAAVLAPTRPVGVVLGRLVELQGYDVTPVPTRAGGTVEVTTHWRLLDRHRPNLMVWLHFRGANLGARFSDDYPLPRPVTGLMSGPQHVSVRRRIEVPPDATPGQYRLVTGVWEPTSESRLHVWWRGLVPTFANALTLGTVEVVGRGD